MKRPLAIVALFYAGGLIAGKYLSVPLTTLFLASFAFLTLAIFSPKKQALLLGITLFLTGWTNLAVHTQSLSPHDLRLQIGPESRQVVVHGRLLDTPSERVYEHDGKESKRSLARLDVTELKGTNTWQPAYGRVMLATFGQLEGDFYDGQEIEITGVIQPPEKPIAPGVFDYRSFLENQSIYYQLNANSPSAWVSLESAEVHTPFTPKFLNWAQRTLHLGLPEEDESLRLLFAMTLGWKTALTDDVSTPFMRTGTMHIFAISGLHIALIAGILVALLRVFRASRLICGFIVIPLIWFYTMATGWQPSAIRSTVMMTIVIAGWSLKRPSDLLNSLGAAAFIILLWDPKQLFQASFQLSFFVVLSIALLVPGFQKFRDRLLQHDPFLPAEFIPHWKRWLGVPVRWLTTMLITSLAAWLGSMPLTAYYFHLFTPISLLANLVIVPLSGFALMSTLGSLICAPICPPLTSVFNAAGWFFMKSMVTCSEWFAHVPFAFRHVATPSLAACFLYYTILLAILNGWFLIKTARNISLSIVAVLAAICFWHWHAERDLWQITALPLSGGEAIYIRAPQKENHLLVDCGSQSSVDSVVKPFLQSQGLDSLPRLLLTHGDLKNIGGATNLIPEFKIQKALFSPLRFRSPAYRALQQDLKTSTNLYQEIKSGDHVNVWNILHPSINDKVRQADDGPVVLQTEIYGTKILLLSDLSREGQHLLLERNPNLKADIVISGLPRDSEPLNDGLLDALQPKLIIITDAEFPATERASVKLRERLSRKNIPVIYCQKAGAVTLRLKPDGWKVETAR